MLTVFFDFIMNILFNLIIYNKIDFGKSEAKKSL